MPQNRYKPRFQLLPQKKAVHLICFGGMPHYILLFSCYWYLVSEYCLRLVYVLVLYCMVVSAAAIYMFTVSIHSFAVAIDLAIVAIYVVAVALDLAIVAIYVSTVASFQSTNPTRNCGISAYMATSIKHMVQMPCALAHVQNTSVFWTF